MNIPQAFFRPFPAYEEVFYDDIENHRQHFLPICSINLQCMDPDLDEWVHFVSVKEIYDGSVGDNTREFHNLYTQEDMLGFDVIDGKYRFEADWNYFIRHQEIQEDPEDQSAMKEAYACNDKDYQIRKTFFQQNNKIYPYSSFRKDLVSVEALQQEFENKQAQGWGLSYPEMNGMLDDIAFMSDEAQEYIEEYGESAEELLAFEMTNLIHVPKRENGEVFRYIGALTGYYFQAYGADKVYLFYDHQLRKAVICFEYS
ncbi:hypothetical protein GCM10010912_36980 [Paenibacillus albidus]|uniref:Siderophore biosynthesis protein n=1 Tax=Paenibacillus albidus TaxID=2041023 RepID=A0A917CI93_9BACL|nr:siderophore biosynthesis protein [Paenibacillus albidus]GGF88306.1 hypothetical protein GCM10010912_36980 [Paenibacillus albidus]